MGYAWERKKNRHAVALGKLGASKGGLARQATMTKEERSHLGRLAVTIRWDRYRAKQKRIAAEASGRAAS